MRIHSFIKVCIAVLTTAFAVTMGTVPGSIRMQDDRVSITKVTQVRLTCNPNDISDISCGTYDKIAPYSWVQRRNDGKTFPFAQNPRNNVGFHVIGLYDTSRGISMLLNIGGMNAIAARMGRQGVGTITGFYEISADNSPETCKQQTTAPGGKCNCDLGSLRPLQGAVGLAEVMKKKDDIVSGTKTRLDLAYDPIKIVRGPNGLLYVTDHHHGARAWLEAGHTMGTCQIQSDTISTEPTQFWADLKALKLVRLADENGNSIMETQLPTKLKDLPDDPYRTLAWMVRKKNGFCRALMQGNTEFAEFKWADWLRTRPELPYNEVKASPKNMRDTALRLAKSSLAAGLPGYRGDKPPNYTCPADPD